MSFVLSKTISLDRNLDDDQAPVVCDPGNHPKGVMPPGHPKKVGNTVAERSEHRIRDVRSIIHGHYHTVFFIDWAILCLFWFNPKKRKNRLVQEFALTWTLK